MYIELISDILLLVKPLEVIDFKILNPQLSPFVTQRMFN